MIYMGNNRKVTNMVLLNHSNVAYSFVDNNLLVLIIIPFYDEACKLKRETVPEESCLSFALAQPATDKTDIFMQGAAADIKGLLLWHEAT